MTLQEKIIVSAYTGYVMCDFSHVHKYIEKKMGRPVWTHELAASNTQFLEEIRWRILPDFLAICKGEPIASPEERIVGQNESGQSND